MLLFEHTKQELNKMKKLLIFEIPPETEEQIEMDLTLYFDDDNKSSSDSTTFGREWPPFPPYGQ